MAGGAGGVQGSHGTGVSMPPLFMPEAIVRRFGFWHPNCGGGRDQGGSQVRLARSGRAVDERAELGRRPG